MSHTKRTPEFCAEVDGLIHRLNLNCLQPADILRLTEILINNTTDTACMVKAAADEPIFVLRAHDQVADQAVEEWVGLAQPFNGHTFEHTPKTLDALECAREMRAYPNRKRPD